MSEKTLPIKNRSHILWIITISILLLGCCAGVYWTLILQYQKTTNDAYVEGNQIVLTSQIAGYIQSINVDDTDVVEEGQVLIQLDPLDQKLNLDLEKHRLAQTIRNVAKMFENVAVLEGEVEAKKAVFAQAARDYKHRKALISIGGVSEEDFQHSESFFIEAFGNLVAKQHQLQGARALVENTTIPTHPTVQKAMNRLREAFIDFSRCTIRSPVSGMIAMKKAQVGESIHPKTPLMLIIPLDQIWVDANFKEVQLKKVRIGQPASIRSDLYGREVIYHGEVVGISAATGSVLSVLPPQNATGNWIKIVQRLPVRIKLEPSEIRRFPLRLGLSMHVTVDTQDTRGKIIPDPVSSARPLYVTDVFSNQEEGVEEIIESILKNNLPSQSQKDENG